MVQREILLDIFRGTKSTRRPIDALDSEWSKLAVKLDCALMVPYPILSMISLGYG